MAKYVTAIITGALLTLIGVFVGQLAVFAPTQYQVWFVVVGSILIAVVPILVNNGIIPAVAKHASLALVISGSLLIAFGEAIAGLAQLFPAPMSVYLTVAGGIVVVVAQVLVANGIIPALKK